MTTMIVGIIIILTLTFLIALIGMAFGVQAWVRTEKIVTLVSNSQAIRENQNRILLRDDVDVDLPANSDVVVTQIGLNSTGDSSYSRLRLRVYLEAADPGAVSASGTLSFAGVMAGWTMVGAVTSAALTFDARQIEGGSLPVMMTNVGPSNVVVTRVEILQ